MAEVIQVGAKVYDGTEWIETGASFEFEKQTGSTLDFEF